MADRIRAFIRPGTLLWCAVVCSLALLVGLPRTPGRARAQPPAAGVRAAGLYRHATWAKYQWFAGAQTSYSKTKSPYIDKPAAIPDAMRADFVKTMAENGVGTIFFFVGSLKEGGEIPLWPVTELSPWHGQEAPIRRMQRELQKAAPGTRTLAWIGGRHKGHERGHIDLADPATRAGIAALSRRLTGPEFGFDGVHLNIEPTLERDEHLLALLDDVSKALPKGKILSFAGTMVLPYVASLPKLRDRFWSEGYLKEVAARVDQMAFMTYDTAITSPAVFQWFLALQARTLLSLSVEANPEIELFLGVPSYREESQFHNSDIENVGTAVDALSAALPEIGSGRANLSGLAVYASWTTSETDWRVIRERFPVQSP
ncbi:MAG: hypothetical protein KDH09_04100 [Chrysiogenetes bacterium]|nr:hypothetical protein [Chrysiogenetes bacterium]